MADTASTIPPGDRVDRCHLSPEGCRKKAAYLAPLVREVPLDDPVGD